MKWLKKFGLPARSAFFTALIAGVISHGMGLFNKFSWHDDISAMFQAGATYKSGRWMLGLLSEFESWLCGGTPVSLPAFNGFLALLLIALSAALVTALLGIRRPLSAVAVGALMVVFPVITGFFGYMFTAHYYSLSLCMTAAGAYLAGRGRHWWMGLLGALLIGASVGIYQAFIPVAAFLLLFRLVLYITEDAQKPAEILKAAAVALLVLAVAIGFYFGMNRLFLQLRHVKLSGYQGISDMGNLTFDTLRERISLAYSEFLSPYEYGEYNMYPQSIRALYPSFLIAAAALSLLQAVRCFLRKKIFSGCAAVPLTLLIPLALNLIFVMADQNVIHSLMTYGQVGLFLWIACLADRLEWKGDQVTKWFRGAMTALLLLLSVMYCRYDNTCYLQAALTQQEAISFCNTLIARIQGTEGYREDLPVVFLRNGWYSDYNLPRIEQLEHITQLPYRGLEFYLNDYTFKSFMKYWCGYAPEYTDEEEIRENPEVMDMPSYPDDGSIRVIGEKIVVNF